MARHPLFFDDPTVAALLDQATEAAIHRLASLMPELDSVEGTGFRILLRQHLVNMLTGQKGMPTTAPGLPRLIHGQDAFGDRFILDHLPVRRAGTGYAVQLLDTDTLLDRKSGRFLPVRDPELSGLFETFDNAYEAARAWLRERDATTDQYAMAIVPAFYDTQMNRHVLIYGVLTQAP